MKSAALPLILLLAAAVCGTAGRSGTVVPGGRGTRPQGTRHEPVPYYAIMPESYNCARTSTAPAIDGDISDAAWMRAAWTNDFLDIIGDLPGYGPAHGQPNLRTRVKMLWDDRCFYFAAELMEPHVNASLLMRDTVIFRDNDFEIFIDPDGDCHRYYEFEVNAYNTVWDLFLDRPYRDKGTPDNGWNIAGLRSAVQVLGTINDARDSDIGWTVEVAIPWSAFTRDVRRPAPPRPHDVWRVNFSRVEWKYRTDGGRYTKIAGIPEDNWVWSPQGVVDMHRPEKWGRVRFTTKPGAPFPIDAATGRQQTGEVACNDAVMNLFRVYWAERAYRDAHGHWAQSLDELTLDPASTADVTPPRLRMMKNGGWECAVDCGGRILTLNHQSLLR